MTQATDSERAELTTEPEQPRQHASLPRQTAAEPAAESGPAGRPSRLLALDGLRLGAALMVVAYHLIGDKLGAWHQPAAAAIFGPLHSAAKYGFLGVQLFFIISGFVICMSAWGRSAGDFFVSRVVRLYPAYWLAVLVTAGVLYAAPRGAQVKARDVLGNLTMMQEFLGIRNLDMSYWTLSVEMIFYVLFVVLVARGLTYRNVVAFCAIWTVASLIVPRFGNQGLTTAVAGGYSCYFVAGIGLYLIYRFGPNLLLWSIVGLSGLIAITRLPGLALARDVSFAPTAAIVACFFLVMAAVALGLLSWVKARWVATAGALTYPLYLIHQTVGIAVIERVQAHLSPWLLITALVAALLVAAWLIHRFVERPTSRWMKRQLSDSLRQVRRSR